jgi:hypothetical protein
MSCQLQEDGLNHSPESIDPRNRTVTKPSMHIEDPGRAAPAERSTILHRTMLATMLATKAIARCSLLRNRSSSASMALATNFKDPLEIAIF